MKITEHKRTCPSCGVILYYSTKYHLARAITKNTKCKNCYMSSESVRKKLSNIAKKRIGKLNSMYGKKRTDEQKKLISIKTKEAMSTPEIRTKMEKIWNSEEFKNKTSKTHSGKIVSAETRLKMSKSAKKRVKRQGFSASSFNPDACILIEKYGRERGYNFQHALNGGEFKVKNSKGKHYYLDGYDKEKNVVLEVDENYHKYTKEYDRKRQEEIINILDCKFIRIPI